MELPIIDRHEIFWQESRLYLLIFAAYAMFICGIIAWSGLHIKWPRFRTIASTLVLLAPCIAFLIYAFVLAAADWRH